MFKFSPPVVLALGLAAASTAFVAAAQATTSSHSGHDMSGHAGHTVPMPATTPTPNAAPLPLLAQKATIVAVPPSIKETSAFVAFKNTGKQAVRLTGVSAQVAGSSMLMKTVKNNNMMGMVGTPELVVPAGGTLTLNPGGDHIMLMSLKRPLKVGEALPITVTDSMGRSLTFKAVVTKP